MSKKTKIEINKEAFSVIELLLVMAIIAIVSSSVLVLVSSQRKRAQESKMLAELTGTLSPMMMCRADDGSISLPSNGSDICDIDEAYGQWPDLSGTDFSTSGYNHSTDLNTNNWYFFVDDGDMRICCNSKSFKCYDLSSLDACSADSP